MRDAPRPAASVPREAADLPATSQEAWMRRVRRVHFVGVGGVGMGGIAEVLHTIGFEVSGSDIGANAMTARLERLGVEIFVGHDGAHVRSRDAVVVSTAISADNPEVVAAREAHLPIVPRAQMLAELMRFRRGIAVAGTHGKTTTTSLCASLLAEGALDPTFVVGGRLLGSGANARLGAGRYLVAEADESDASFLYLQPVMAVVTNVDADHMETYGGDFGRLRQAFLDFLHRLPFYGLAVLCHDDATLREMLPEVARPVVTYGIGEGADVQGTDIFIDGARTHFKVHRRGYQEVMDVTLNLPGEHNVQNALAAIAVATELDVDDVAISRALEGFAGIARRFQIHGDLDTPAGRITLVDDYAHHPSELTATLKAVRAGWPGRRLLVVYQPHRYSRTRDLFEDFTRVLAETDALVLLEVYRAGEDPLPGADGRTLARAVRARGKVDPVFARSVDEVPDLLPGLITPGDVVLTLGAGDIGSLPARLRDIWPTVAADK